MKCLILVMLTLTSCASFNDYTPRTFVRTEHKRNYQPVDSKEFKVEDKNLVVTYQPDTSDAGTSFQFQNKTNSVIKILWDETVYLSPDGLSQKVFHSGVKIADRDQSLPPSILPPKSSFNDDILPTGNVRWVASGWSYDPLCGTRANVTHMLQDDACLGQVFGYFITYEIDGKKKNLTAKFKYISKEPKTASVSK